MGLIATAFLGFNLAMLVAAGCGAIRHASSHRGARKRSRGMGARGRCGS